MNIFPSRYDRINCTTNVRKPSVKNHWSTFYSRLRESYREQEVRGLIKFDTRTPEIFSFFRGSAVFHRRRALLCTPSTSRRPFQNPGFARAGPHLQLQFIFIPSAAPCPLLCRYNSKRVGTRRKRCAAFAKNPRTSNFPVFDNVSRGGP